MGDGQVVWPAGGDAPELFLHQCRNHFQLFIPRQSMVMIETDVTVDGVTQAGAETRTKFYLMLPNGAHSR